jgi:hypothetical protein
MGIIMAVVAVLLIHMDRNHVGSIRPNINLKYRSQAMVTRVTGHGNTGHIKKIRVHGNIMSA